MTLNKQDKREQGGGRGIEWCDFTWNPVAGCEHQCRWTMPDGTVAECYAETIAEGVARKAYAEGFAHHYWKPQHLDSPKKLATSARIFVGSMSDLFGAAVPSEHIRLVLDVCRECPQHTFQLLTKNPVRVSEFDLPLNVWVGASMPPDFMWGKALDERQRERMLDKMLRLLTDVDAVVRWMSFEPLSWDVSKIVAQYPDALEWAVIGAASKGRKYYAPDAGHFRNLLDVLDYQEVAVFYKGNLSSLGEVAKPWREAYPRVSMVEDMRDILGDEAKKNQRRLL